MRHAFASIEGMRLHWAELGDATATVPVVLLHGMLDAHLTWRTVASTLAVDRRVLMPDLPGCGWSERPDASYSNALRESGGWSWSPLEASAAASGSGCASLPFHG